MAPAFDPGGFSNVDASGSPAAYSANLDRAQAIGAIIENRRLVREALALAAGDVVLDVGSGNGEEAQAIAALVAPGGRVVGIDLSGALVEEARRRLPETLANVEFSVADAQALPFPDGSSMPRGRSVCFSTSKTLLRSPGRWCVWCGLVGAWPPGSPIGG